MKQIHFKLNFITISITIVLFCGILVGATRRQANQPLNEATKIITLSEFENCVKGDCKGIKYIVKTRVISFVAKPRYVHSPPNCQGYESFGDEITNPATIKTLFFGDWINPSCKGRVADDEWQGTGWHADIGSCCKGGPHKKTRVQKVTMEVTYLTE